MTKAKKEIAIDPTEYLTSRGAHRRLHGMYPWDIQHHPGHSEIELYSELSGEWEVPIVVSGLNHVAIAEFIISAANQRNLTPNLLNEAIAALELCLEDTNLSLKPAKAAASVVLRAESRNGGQNAS
jgi:hypothetical protein